MRSMLVQRRSSVSSRRVSGEGGQLAADAQQARRHVDQELVDPVFTHQGAR